MGPCCAWGGEQRLGFQRKLCLIPFWTVSCEVQYLTCLEPLPFAQQGGWSTVDAHMLNEPTGHMTCQLEGTLGTSKPITLIFKYLKNFYP